MVLNKISKIEWLDSFGVSSSWEDLEDLQNNVELRCISIGYIVQETDNYILIVPHIHGEFSDGARKAPQSGCGDMAIPKRSILSIIELTEDY